MAREKGAKHFVLLSAICVQKPLLEFQKAKLKLESDLQVRGGRGVRSSYRRIRHVCLCVRVTLLPVRLQQAQGTPAEASCDLHAKSNAETQEDVWRAQGPNGHGDWQLTHA